MHNDLKELKKYIIALSDDELLRMVHIEYGNYRQEAIEIAKEEVKKRNIQEIIDDKKEELSINNRTSGDKTAIWSLIVVVIANAIATNLRNILPPPIYEIVFYVTIGAIGGVIIGLLPYFVGKKKGQIKLAKISIICSTVVGSVLGLLVAVPVAIIFTIILLRHKKTEHY